MDRHFFRAQQILKNRKAAGDVKGGDAVRPLFQPAEWDHDFYNIPTRERRKILRMVKNCQAKDAERLERYVRESTLRFYSQEAAA